MGRPVVRLGIDVDNPTWKTLRKLEKFTGVRTYDFSVDTSQPTVWLYVVGDDEVTIGRLHDITTKAGGLPMKSAGEWRDSAESYQQLFRAEVRIARLRLRMAAASGGPDAEYLAAKEDYRAALRARDSAKQTFSAALERDTERVAQHVEEFGAEDIDVEQLGQVN